MTRVFLVDDHLLIRDALGERLERETDIEVVGAAASAAECLEGIAVASPHVVLMDIDMPGMDESDIETARNASFEAARRVREELPAVRVVFLSAYTHDHYIEEALRCGALGYLTKFEPPGRVVEAIRAVAQGRVSFSDEVMERVVLDADGPRLAAAGRSRGSTLTEREIEILRHLAEGLGKKEIATRLGLSVKTIDTHALNLMAKLAIHDRVELARYAIREGYVEP